MTRPLRIAHISDTHLGYRALPIQDPLTGRNQRSVDIERAFSAAIDDLLRQEVDLVIHAGDVFHQSRPSWHAVRHFVSEMRRVERAGIPAVIIAGNHDTPRYRAGGSVFTLLEVALPDARISAGYQEEEIVFDDLGLRVQTVPHGALTNPDPPVTFTTPETRNILVTHGLTPGLIEPGKSTEPGEQNLESDLFPPGFDYVALGHYHIHTGPFQPAWYSGATERMGWGDADVEPGYLLVTMAEDGLAGPPEHRRVPSRASHTLKPVYGDSKSPREMTDDVLGQLERIGDPHALTRVQVRDADRQVYREVERALRRESTGRTMHLTVSRLKPVDSVLSVDVERAASIGDLQTLFAKFVERRTGEQYSADFAARFLERGRAALHEAQQRVNDSIVEGGGA